METIRVCRNGKVALEDQKFAFNADAKNAFLLSNYENPKTRKTNKGYLMKLDNFERRLNKDIINFTLEEYEEFLISLQAKKLDSLKGKISVIKQYVKKTFGEASYNLSALPQIRDFNKYCEEKYITYRTLIEMEDSLINDCDKCLLELLFNGVKPNEIPKIKHSDIDFEKLTIKIISDSSIRLIYGCTERCFSLLKRTIEETSYIEKNGADMDRRQRFFAQSTFVFKKVGGGIDDNPVEPSYLQDRVRQINKWLDIEDNLTVTSIYQSGILHASYIIIQKSANNKLFKDRNAVAQLAQRFNFCNQVYNENRKINDEVGRLQRLIKNGIKSTYTDDYFITESELFYINCEYEELVEQNFELESIVDVKNPEGAKKEYYVTRYERDPVNRQNAIRIHGLTCHVCGFNFKGFYGDIGENFIEVHHIKPLHTLDEEVIINPETDLVCVCSNCHSMIHHKKDAILTVDELKELIRKQ